MEWLQRLSYIEVKWFLFEWLVGTHRFQRFLKTSFTPGPVHTAKNNQDQKEQEKKKIFNSWEVKCIKAIKGNYKRKAGFGLVNVS